MSGGATTSTASTDGQEFCLRWNNHQTTIVSILEQQFRNEAFVDVTLAVEGLALRAHKMVLCACSPYFSALLSNTPDKHPIVILRDVGYKDMRALLDFMYRGEVSVSQDCLDRLLKVAESLRIRGLADVSEQNLKASQGGSRSRGLAQEILQTTQQHLQTHPASAASPLSMPLRSSPTNLGGPFQGLHVIAEAAASKRPLLASVGAGGSVASLNLSSSSGVVSPSTPGSPSAMAGARKRRGRPRTVSSPTASSTPLAAPASPPAESEESRDKCEFSSVENLSMSAGSFEKEYGESMEKRPKMKQEPEDLSDTGVVVKTEPEDSSSITEGSTPSSVLGEGSRLRLASSSSATFSDSGEGSEASGIGPPPYKCPYCPKEFLESKAYLRHRDRTHASISRPCPDCDATFKRTDHLSRHMRTVHSHACPVCQETLSGQLAFETHLSALHSLPQPKPPQP
ncbi:unnamed protein product [Notodromas monacha]|uniref:Uncharacterized protein n=1 Tax=Notodromas monacha TaxID=399045 RepID=A0A7R9BNV5_9CRUS|nr:unnamed protein product [Notodromas monacha]CAG0918633.1 unnamed protein product [Notodromas monacha]